MKTKLTSLLLSLGFLLPASNAQVPPPEKILPADTIGVLTVPDCRDARADFGKNGLARMLEDPEMKPFNDHFKQGFEEAIVTPFERETGLKVDELLGLAQGQITLAVTQSGWEGAPGTMPGFLVLVDAGEEKSRLADSIQKLKQKAIDSGQSIQTETIRNVEFSMLPLEDGDDAPKLFVGQSDSLLVAGTDRQTIEEVLVRQSGGAITTLSENPGFAANYNTFLRDSAIFGWVNVEILTGIAQKAFEALPDNPDNPVSPKQILESLGVMGLKTAAFNYKSSERGDEGMFYLGVPESDRKGLFKLIDFEAKNAAIPAFVPGTAISFSRWRFDGQKAWATLESMITEINPQMAGFLQMMLGAFGKDKDPNFDFKTQFIGNLGDDLISYAKAPKDESWESLTNQPQLFLVGSPNADGLLGALKLLSSFIADSMGGLNEREVEGRTIYGLNLVPATGQKVEFTASQGYVAIATDAAILDEYLRNSGGGDHPLRETQGLTQAAEVVGGMNTGFFGFENDKENMKFFFRLLKNNPDFFQNIFSDLPVEENEEFNPGEVLGKLFDFKLLPDADQIAKYFDLTVYAGNSDDKGISVKAYTPNPPGLN